MSLMHIVISWEITAEGERLDEIKEALRANLKGYSWVKPLSNFFIVKVEGADERSTIIDALNSVAKETPETVHIIVSPLMSGGRYNGWLPKRLWPKIRKRTDEDA